MPSPELRIHHVGLTVSDIEQSIRFYTDLLGLELVRRRIADAPYIAEQTGYPGARLAAASLAASGKAGPSLEVVEYLEHAGSPADQATNRPGNSHLCFQVDDIRAMYDRLTAAGVRFKTPPVTITSGPNEGGFVAYFYDPDGHTLELFQPRTSTGDC